MKYQLWILNFMVGGFFSTAVAQDMPEYKDGIQSLVLEAVTQQHNEIVRAIDSLKGNNSQTTPDEIMLFRRLRAIEGEIPLSYNEKIKDYIDKYTSKNYKPYIGKLQGLSTYYFPIFEQILKEAGVPTELKYLSVVESSLDPHCVSTSGAVGPWQFMYATAKGYELTMDSHVDERKDPYSSSYAASSYFKEAYAEFDDWLLAIASYNCGRGAVRRAIKRSGMHKPDFWQLAPFLPQETRNYIPKFIAMTYVLNHVKEYDIPSVASDLSWDSKVVMVDKQIDLAQVAQAVDVPVETLKKFNPSTKRSFIQGTAEKPRRLVLPQTQNLNDSLLYLALNSPQLMPAASQALAAVESPSTGDTHKVRSGESLRSIADKYGVTVQNLKAWNKLSARSVLLGRTLTVKSAAPVRLARAKDTSKGSSNKSAVRYTTYAVRKGDTLSEIAGKFKGATVTQIKQDNNISSSHLKIGRKLKIRTRS